MSFRSVAIFLVSFFAPFGVAYSQTEALSPEVLKSCEGHASVARMIMEKRQQGYRMVEMMSVTEELGEFQAPAQFMIRMAYDRPQYRTPQMQNKEITTFENEIYAACLDGLHKRKK